MTDGKGRQINFKNTIIIMTSNLGSDEFNEKAAQIGFNTSEKDEEKIIADFDNIRARVMKQLPEFFAPEFINRIDKTIVFRPLDKKILQKIIVLQLDELIERLKQIGISATYDKKLISLILEETFSPEYGARPVRRFIQDKIEDKIADAMILNSKKKIVSISALKNEIIFDWQ